MGVRLTSIFGFFFLYYESEKYKAFYLNINLKAKIKNRTSYLSWLTEHINIFSGFFEYETPKVVTVQNVPLGILRLLLQTAVIAFVVIYQLWYARGYQEFAEVEASVTTKVKGFSM